MVSNPKPTVNSANDEKLAYKWNNMYKEKLNAPASVNSPSDAIVASENDTVEDIHDIKKYGNGSFGNYVLVSYDYLAIYAHLNSAPSHLNIGQKINAEGYIGDTGNTGNSFGVHLHFGLVKNVPNNNYQNLVTNKYWVDPMEWGGSNWYAKPPFYNYYGLVSYAEVSSSTSTVSW